MAVPSPRDAVSRGRDTDQRLEILEARIGRGTPARLTDTGRGPAAERDVYYGVPTTLAQQVALANRKPTWFNTDMGWEEEYFAVTGSAGLTARGLALNAPAGWYPLNDGPRGRLSAAGSQLRNNGELFTNWNNFGVATAGGESWRSHTLIDRPPGDAATIRTRLPGRYDMEIEMFLPNGSGTGVWSFRYIDGVASSYVRAQPAVLLGGYGQFAVGRFRNVILFDTGRCYFSTDSASWTIGDTGAWMDMRYLGPPLVSA